MTLIILDEDNPINQMDNYLSIKVYSSEKVARLSKNTSSISKYSLHFFKLICIVVTFLLYVNVNFRTLTRTHNPVIFCYISIDFMSRC